jgi:hypothetical protein
MSPKPMTNPERFRPKIDEALLDDLETLQEHLGHDNLTTTVNWLLRVSVGRAIAEAEAMTRRLNE